MSEPIFVSNTPLFSNTSIASSQSSPVQDIGEGIGYACHFIWSGSAAGTFSVAGGNDPNPANFVTVASQAAGGAGGVWLLNVEAAKYKYVQAVFTSVSGTGTVTCNMTVKRS